MKGVAAFHVKEITLLTFATTNKRKEKGTFKICTLSKNAE